MEEDSCFGFKLESLNSIIRHANGIGLEDPGFRIVWHDMRVELTNVCNLYFRPRRAVVGLKLAGRTRCWEVEESGFSGIAVEGKLR